jgi:hypothetical protein
MYYYSYSTIIVSLLLSLFHPRNRPIRCPLAWRPSFCVLASPKAPDNKAGPMGIDWFSAAGGQKHHGKG